MKRVFLSGLFTSFGLPDSTFNYLTPSTVTAAGAAIQHDAATILVKLDFHCQVAHL
jgi:hypothetical protein